MENECIGQPVTEIVDRRTSTVGVEDPPYTLAEVDRVFSEPKPIRDYLLVRQNAKETTYAGTHFVIPESVQQSPNKGVVVAVGPELEGEKPLVKPGDVVTFGKFNAEPISVDGEDYQLVRFYDVKLIESVTYAIGG
jgi:chaperonin GroES